MARMFTEQANRSQTGPARPPKPRAPASDSDEDDKPPEPELTGEPTACHLLRILGRLLRRRHVRGGGVGVAAETAAEEVAAGAGPGALRIGIGAPASPLSRTTPSRRRETLLASAPVHRHHLPFVRLTVRGFLSPRSCCISGGADNQGLRGGRLLRVPAAAQTRVQRRGAAAVERDRWADLESLPQALAEGAP